MTAKTKKADSTALVVPEIAESPELKNALAFATEAEDLAKEIVIDSQSMYETGAAEIRAIDNRKREINETRLSITRPMDEAKARIMALFAPPIERLTAASEAWRRAMISFVEKQRAEAEEIRQREETRQREERERLEAEAAAAERERARLEEERQSATSKKALERIAEKLDKVEEKIESAHEAIAAAEVAPPLPVTFRPPSASGSFTRETWKHEVQDLAALVCAAADRYRADPSDPTLLGYLMADDTAIGAVARALKSSARIPGVRIYSASGLTVRKT